MLIFARRTPCLLSCFAAPKKTAANAILERLGKSNRRVLSDWRALILVGQATFEIPRDERRWSKLPREFEGYLAAAAPDARQGRST
jgi:hypothetical protein